jgi:hypothetical protein
MITADELEARLLKQNKHVSLDQCVLPDVAAEVLDVSEKTLKNWRYLGSGPDFILKARVWYPLTAVVEYMAAQTK